MSKLYSQKIIINRTAAGTWSSDGEDFNNGFVSTFTKKCSVQPLTSKELQVLPEGMRSSRILKVYTSRSSANKIRTVDRDGATIPDYITYQGKSFQIYSTEDWNESLSGKTPHFKFYISETSANG